MILWTYSHSFDKDSLSLSLILRNNVRAAEFLGFVRVCTSHPVCGAVCSVFVLGGVVPLIGWYPAIHEPEWGATGKQRRGAWWGGGERGGGGGYRGVVGKGNVSDQVESDPLNTESCVSDVWSILGEFSVIHIPAVWTSALKIVTGSTVCVAMVTPTGDVTACTAICRVCFFSHTQTGYLPLKMTSFLLIFLQLNHNSKPQ